MTSKKYAPQVLFILGFTIFLFTRFSKVIPSLIPAGLAMIIAPIFILRFSRTLEFKKAIRLTLSGFVFVYSWFASVVNYCWENGFIWKKIKKIVIVYASILLMLSLFGAN